MFSREELEAASKQLGERAPSAFARKIDYLTVDVALSNRARELAHREFLSRSPTSIPFADVILVFFNGRLQQKDAEASCKTTAYAHLDKSHWDLRNRQEIVTQKGYSPRIEISPRYVKLYPWDIDGILLHELCHFCPGCYNHSSQFYRWMDEVGATRHCYSLPTSWNRHVYRHIECGYTKTFNTRLNQELSAVNYCPACMENLSIRPMTFYGTYNPDLDIIIPAHDDQRSEAILKEMGKP